MRHAILALFIFACIGAVQAAPYHLTNNNLAADAQNIIRESDGANIPPDPRNADDQIYLQWLSSGCSGPCTPDPAPAPPAPTPQQQYAAAVAAGLTITWQTSTTLNATYPLGNDPITQTPIAVEALAELDNISAKGTFISGLTTRNWPDVTGTPHVMTVAQFEAMYGACAAYLDALATALGTALQGQTAMALPSTSVTINQ